ncbi:hypothetical protein ES703_66931 [subsurface metagenome]
MVSKAHALAREALVRALTAYSGITTADGAFDGTATLVDSNLIGRNDFISEKTILIMSGDAKDEDKGATSFNKVNGTITLQGTGFSAQIKAGTVYKVLNISTTETDVANIDADVDPKVMGRSQIFEKSITSAANVGDVTVATITTQPCQIESIVIHADAAQTGDMTSCGVFGGAGKVITFIAAADAVQANLDAEDKQVAWTGAVRLAATKTIVISLVGTGATAVDLTIIIKYRACVSGGYLA